MSQIALGNSAAPETEFFRERLAAVSNTLGAWPRCERVACRRAGECRGKDEPLPRCLPFVTAMIRVCAASCAATVPELASSGDEKPSLTPRLNELVHRTMGLLEHQIGTMEDEIKGKSRSAAL
jgi:hypothetical protein